MTTVELKYGSKLCMQAKIILKYLDLRANKKRAGQKGTTIKGWELSFTSFKCNNLLQGQYQLISFWYCP